MTSSLPSLIDTHAHLDSDQFDTDRSDVLARAAENGISHILSVGCDLESSRQNIALAKAHPNIYASVGIHPHDAPQATPDGIAELRRMVHENDKIVAIGEIGLDFYRDRAPRERGRPALLQR